MGARIDAGRDISVDLAAAVDLKLLCVPRTHEESAGPPWANRLRGSPSNASIQEVKASGIVATSNGYRFLD